MAVLNACGLYCCYLDAVHERQHKLHGLMSWGFCFMLGSLSEFVFLHFGRLSGWFWYFIRIACINCSEDTQ